MAVLPGMYPFSATLSTHPASTPQNLAVIGTESEKFMGTLGQVSTHLVVTADPRQFPDKGAEDGAAAASSHLESTTIVDDDED